MASSKQQTTIPAPSSGVRKDVNELVQDASMAADGKNVVYFDGTIRPRPALDYEVGAAFIPSDDLERIYDTEAAATEIGAVCETDDEYLLVARDDAVMDHSVDLGKNWSSGVLNYPGSLDVVYMEQIGTYIYAFDDGNVLWRAPASTLPTSLTWTAIATSIGTAPLTRYSEFFYDETADAWIVTASSSSLNEPQITAVIGVSTGTVTKQTLLSGTAAIGTGFSLRGKGSVSTDFDWIIYSGWSTDATGQQQALFAYSLAWSSGTSTYTVGTERQTFTICSVSPLVNPMGSPTLDKDLFRCGGGYAMAGGIVMFSCFGREESWVGRIALDADGWADPSTAEYVPINVAGDVQHDDTEVTGDRVLFMKAPESSYHMQTFMVSKNLGKSWFIIDSGLVSEDYRNTWWFSSNRNTGRDYSWSQVSDLPNNWSELWQIPSVAESNTRGDFIHMKQLDLDDEEDVIVVGTTKELARLNTSTQLWERITADNTETVPGAPASTWILPPDVPPLSASEDDANYVSGVSINAVHGQHPWVFRTTLANGEIFLIATNGQCYPICYNSTMNGAFARRLGEVPDGDPNDYTLSPEDLAVGWLQTGNLAPKAKCMAVAANRVILANNPAGSPFEVNVGGFNDCDRGWGTADSQLVLLGDTEGEIVTMEEINALQVAIYKEDAIYHAVAQNEFGGVVAPFRFELSKAGIPGPCSPASVLRNHDGRQIYLARDGGVYMYDGVAPLDGGRNIRRMIQSSIDYNELGKVWGMMDQQRKLAWFFFPSSSGYVNRGIVISTDQGYPWPAWDVSLPDNWDFTCGGGVTVTDDAVLGDLDEFGSYTGGETLASFSTGDVGMLAGRKSGVFFFQKWDDNGDFTDDGAPIDVHLRTGWTTPGGVQIHSADELYHIFSSPDPKQELEVRLRAQKVGQNIVTRGPRQLYAEKSRRRTRHRVGGVQFSVDLKGSVSRMFNWGGAVMTHSSGGRKRG